MNSLFRILFLLSFTLTISCQSPSTHRNLASTFAISNNTLQLAEWETRANGVSLRSNDLIHLEHYEVPLRLLKSDFDEHLDETIKSSMIFNKNGEEYVRWLINPEDSKWHLEVKQFLENHNLDSSPKSFFHGYLTASRSMIILNPNNGASFSLKVSTNLTGGKWTEKKQTWQDAQQVRAINKWISHILPKMQTENLVIMNEPAAWGIPELDHGMIMRSLNDLPQNDHYYLPAFSALHEEEGFKIAKLNGATNPRDYWNTHLVQPMALAMAEYFAITGSWYDSPHAQNFLLELDSDMKPTGRVVLRDLGDSYIILDFLKNTQYAELLNVWDKENIVKNSITVGIGLLHGNKLPNWLRELEYKEYGWEFFRIFEKRFSEITGIPMKELMKTDSKEMLYSYTKKTYPTTSDAWTKFLKYANCMNGESSTLMGEKCPDFYLKKHKKTQCYEAVNQILAN